MCDGLENIPIRGCWGGAFFLMTDGLLQRLNLQLQSLHGLVPGFAEEARTSLLVSSGVPFTHSLFPELMQHLVGAQRRRKEDGLAPAKAGEGVLGFGRRKDLCEVFSEGADVGGGPFAVTADLLSDEGDVLEMPFVISLGQKPRYRWSQPSDEPRSVNAIYKAHLLCSRGP